MQPDMTRRFRLVALPVLLAGLLPLRSVHADWPQFRGPNSSGQAAMAAPLEFGPGKNELWSIPLDSGHSSPCVVGQTIFVTTYHEQSRKLKVVCIDRSNGKIRWERQVPANRIETGHPSFNPASSTPASDGERVVAYFGSSGLFCFDMQGMQLWEKKLPLTKSYAGNATSPAIFGDRVILYRGNHVDHFVLALNKVTGEQLWKAPQDEKFESELACTATPIRAGGKLILHTARAVQAIDLQTGKRIWIARCATTATSTPVIAGKEVIVAAWNKMGEPALRPAFPAFEQLVQDNDKDGDRLISREEFPRMMIFHRPDGSEAPQNGAPMRFSSTDHNRNGKIESSEWKQMLAGLARFRGRYDTHGMLAIPLDSKGLVDPARIRTLERISIPEVPTPLVYEGKVYFVKNGGVLSAVDLASGKRLARMRTGGSGTHYASPVIAGGKLYSTSGRGEISVLTLGEKPEVIAKNRMGEGVYATPAIVDGVIYVRTFSKLFAFGRKQLPLR